MHTHAHAVISSAEREKEKQEEDSRLRQGEEGQLKRTSLPTLRGASPARPGAACHGGKRPPTPRAQVFRGHGSLEKRREERGTMAREAPAGHALEDRRSSLSAAELAAWGSARGRAGQCWLHSPPCPFGSRHRKSHESAAEAARLRGLCCSRCCALAAPCPTDPHVYRP